MPHNSPNSAPVLEVSEAEAGQKLLQFLARRLGLSQNMLHRWIRTGQVRRNAMRAKAFDRVLAGELVRVPPFALRMAATVPSAALAPPLPELVASLPDLLVFNKPSGLPVQPGSGHTDSLSSRLAVHFAEASFRPTPAHRLDKDSSGLVLVATSYERLRALHEAFAGRRVGKEYLAWVEAVWPHSSSCLLEDFVAKGGAPGHERMRAGQGRQALCAVQRLYADGDKSLVHIQLVTGRTHQIRLQLAERGHPLCGDLKYGARPCATGFFLHAFRLNLPEGTFVCEPPWTGEWQLPAAVSLPALAYRI